MSRIMFLLETAAEEAGGGRAVSDIFSIIFAVWIILGLVVYFVPTMVAFKKKHLNKTAILLLNLFLGWTFVGWVVALVWSVKKTDKPA